MPIYAYRCTECGFAADVLQKMSDAELTNCPTCGKATFTKQVTAAGFQLKGTGWYVTDFRGGSGGTASPSGNTVKNSVKSESDSGNAATSSSTDTTTSSANTGSTQTQSSGTSSTGSSSPASGTPNSTT